MKKIPNPLKGKCYILSEALYHMLGGKDAGWTPMRIQHEGKSHWFLKHISGTVLDATASQFKSYIHYWNGVGCGFLTKKPSKKTRELLKKGLKDD